MIFKYMIDLDSSILRYPDVNGQTPLHVACCSKFITSNTVQIIVDGWKEATNKANRIKQGLPIHCLCENLELERKLSLMYCA